MAINGLSGLNGLYGYSNSINNLKLSQALNKSDSSNIKSSIKGKSASDYLSSESSNFLNSYNRDMSALLSSANSLRASNSASQTNKVTASSSDESVATVNSYMGLKANTADLTINVAQLASSQTNTLRADALGAGDASFTISSQSGEGGVAQINVSRTDADGNRKSDTQFLTDMASQINRTNIGVKASVVTGEDGVKTLQVSSKYTGENNTFSISGEFAENSGLSDVAKAGQNAIFSVTENGVETNYSKSTNYAYVGSGNASITLQGEGETVLSAKKDTSSIISGVEDLIKKYNAAYKTVSANTDRGTGTLNQFSRMQRGVISSFAMERLGITTGEDGTLSLDKEKLAKSLAEQPDITMGVIAGPTGLAQKAYDLAQSGLNKSATSLIGNDIKLAELQKMADDASIIATGYGRGMGAYTMSNLYAVSSMMNYSMMNYLV